VEIHRIAGVGALQKLEPGGVPGGGCGSIAAEAYRVPGSASVVPAPKCRKMSVRHGDSLFQTPEYQVFVGDSLRTAPRSKLSNFDQGD
jgi:hypothetical protein